jgi:hypothetical protein
LASPIRPLVEPVSTKRRSALSVMLSISTLHDMVEATSRVKLGLTHVPVRRLGRAASIETEAATVPRSRKLRGKRNLRPYLVTEAVVSTAGAGATAGTAVGTEIT